MTAVLLQAQRWILTILASRLQRSLVPAQCRHPIQIAAGMNKMKQEILFYKRAYEDSSQNALWHYMVEYFTKRYSNLAKEKLGTDLLDPQLAYSIRFYCMGPSA